MPLSAALELLFSVLCVAKVVGGEGDSIHAEGETSFFWVGLVLQQQFGSMAVLVTTPAMARTTCPVSLCSSSGSSLI